MCYFNQIKLFYQAVFVILSKHEVGYYDLIIIIIVDLFNGDTFLMGKMVGLISHVNPKLHGSH
jgi:hypothetical protein